jgi:excisionase family DNA binding protein
MTGVGDEAQGFLKVPEVAKRLKCSAKSVYRLIWAHDRGEDGGLEAVTIGTRSRRVHPDALKEYEDRLRAGARKPAA